MRVPDPKYKRHEHSPCTSNIRWSTPHTRVQSSQEHNKICRPKLPWRRLPQKRTTRDTYRTPVKVGQGKTKESSLWSKSDRETAQCHQNGLSRPRNTTERLLLATDITTLSNILQPCHIYYNLVLIYYNHGHKKTLGKYLVVLTSLWNDKLNTNLFSPVFEPLSSTSSTWNR